MLRMRQWPWCYLFCQLKLRIHPICITTTKSLVNYRTYKTTDCWRSIDTHLKVLSIQHLLPSIYVFILIWLYWLSFCLIEIWPCGKAERHNYLALFTLTWLKILYQSKDSLRLLYIYLWTDIHMLLIVHRWSISNWNSRLRYIKLVNH